MLTRNDIRQIAALSDKQERDRTGLFIVEGRKMVRELLDSGWKVERLLSTMPDAPYGAETVSMKDMERMSCLKTPTDTLAVVRTRRSVPNDPGDLILALDRVQNPGNMGTIVRLADWFGIRTLLCSPETADVFSPKTVQATMGSVFRVSVLYGDLPDMLREASRDGRTVCGTMLEGGTDIYETDLPMRAVLVMGSEGQGISPQVAETLGMRLFIPRFSAGSGPESLNVAVAAALACSEFRRRGRRR